HEIWKRDFNGDPNIVGQSVRINGKAATIIGVMPPNFQFPFSEQLWVSLYNEFPPIPRGQLVIGANNAAPAVMGRLKPGVSIDQVNAEFVGLARRLAQDNPKTNSTLTSASVQPLLKAMTGPQLRQQVWGMLGAVLVFTVAITLVATIVSGLVPALVSSKGNAAEIMKEGGRGNSSRLVNIITRALVVGQIALTAALLIAATLQIKSIRNQITLN